MNLWIYFSIGIGLYFSYSWFRSWAARSAFAAAYRREMHDLLTNKKYQVKGRFEE